MEIMPVGNLTTIVEPSQQGENRQQQQRRQPPPKRERFAPVSVYTPSGGIEEEQPPKIDVLV